MRLYAVSMVVFASLLLTERASAHGMGAECRLVADGVEVEAYYDDNTPARQARVRVYNANKKVVAEGRTDDKGRSVFPRPDVGAYEVVVDAGGGHRHTVSLQITEAAPPSQPQRVSAGPSRDETTATPLPRLLVGLAFIGGGAALFLLVSAFRKRHGAGSSITEPRVEKEA
jgi:nickel transport protein